MCTHTDKNKKNRERESEQKRGEEIMDISKLKKTFF